eukprot:437185_1
MKYSTAGYVVTFGFIVTSTVISELAQIVSDRYDKPFIIRYVNDSCNIFGIIIPFIWLCTTPLFKKKVQKDRTKLLKQHLQRQKSLSPSPNTITDSLSYIYQGSPLGMGASHPINQYTHSVSDGSYSLFNDDLSILSMNGAVKYEPNNSLPQSIAIEENKNKSVINVNNTSESSNNIVELHLFHPNPNEYIKYKKSIKHVNSTVYIALVKSKIYYFVPFCILLSWLYSGGGMLWYLSLTGTTVPTNVCLARFRVLFVFFMSAVFFDETVNLWKIIGIIFAFGSVCLFAIEIESQKPDNGSKTHDTLSGALLILLAALFSGMGDVVYRIGANKTLNRDNIYGLPLIVTFFFNGLYGLVIASTFWGVFYIEEFEMPNLEDIYLIFGVSIVLMFANVVQFISITMTSPFFLNVCLFLKIPLSFGIDIFIHDYKLGLYSTIAGLLVIIGFLMLEIISPPKWFGKCKYILEYPCCKKHIENVRKRTLSFNVDITSTTDR